VTNKDQSDGLFCPKNKNPETTKVMQKMRGQVKRAKRVEGFLGTTCQATTYFVGGKKNLDSKKTERMWKGKSKYLGGC